jgi:hypothetical protein
MLKRPAAKYIYIYISVVEEGWRNWAKRSPRRVKTGWKWEFEFTLVAVGQCKQL